MSVTHPVPSANDFLALDNNGALDLTKDVLRTLNSTAGAPPATNSAVVVRIDSDGFVVGTGSPGTQGALISMTCWMSVTPVP